MRTATKLVVLEGQTYAAYVRALRPALWFRLNEASGNALNYGSLGATYNGVLTACTQAQAGKLGASSAVLFDGANSKITVPAGAYANDAAVTVAALVNLSGAGENNGGRLFDITVAALAANLLTNATLNLSSSRSLSGVSTASTVIATSAWRWVFYTYNNAGDKKIRLTIGASGTATEVAYSTQTAFSSLSDLSTGDLVIGNKATQDRTLAGLYDEFLWFSAVLTAAQMAQLVRLTGV